MESEAACGLHHECLCGSSLEFAVQCVGFAAVLPWGDGASPSLHGPKEGRAEEAEEKEEAEAARAPEAAEAAAAAAEVRREVEGKNAERRCAELDGRGRLSRKDDWQSQSGGPKA